MSYRLAASTPIYEKGRRRRRVRPVAPGQRQPRKHDRKHLDLVRQLPCIVSGTPGPSEAAHIRYGDAPSGKPHTGMAEKPDDCWTVPLCAELHRLLDVAQHNANERAWWEGHGIDPLAAARELHAVSGHLPAMEEIVLIRLSPTGARC